MDESIAAPWDAASSLGSEPKWLKDSVEGGRLEADFIDADVTDTGRAIVSRSATGDFELPDFDAHDDDDDDAPETSKRSKSGVKDEVRKIVHGVLGKKKSKSDDEYDVDADTARAVRANKHLLHHSNSKYS